jgi:hypothetical protein
LSGRKLTTAAKAIHVVQTSSPRVPAKSLFPILSPRRCGWRKYVEGFLPAPLWASEFGETRFCLA